jgi:hypothetical protein
MQAILKITLDESGKLFFVPNTVQILSGGSLSIAYVVNAAPATLSIIVMGVINATGDTIVLDTYTGTSNTTRTIALANNFDAFLITANWTGGANVTVGATITSTGSGPSYSGGGIAVPTTGIGSPNNVLAAPVGSIYLNLTGGSTNTLWVKESGGSTSAGWTAK